MAGSLCSKMTVTKPPALNTDFVRKRVRCGTQGEHSVTQGEKNGREAGGGRPEMRRSSLVSDLQGGTFAS